MTFEPKKNVRKVENNFYPVYMYVIFAFSHISFTLTFEKVYLSQNAVVMV